MFGKHIPKRSILHLALLVIAAALLTSCAQPTPEVVKVTATPKPEQPVRVYGIYATKLTEPWDQAIHRPLLKLKEEGLITYEWSEALGYSGELEREMRRVVHEWDPDLLIGDAFGNEDPVRRVAEENPNIAFAFGSAGGPAAPSFSVFDNWNHDGAYIAGQIAGRLTESNVVGMVLGKDCAEVNRLGNAFAAGARAENPEVTVLATYIDSWFDPAKAEEHAQAKIEAGADFLYCERVGCEQAARKAEGQTWVVGQMVDQHEKAPARTITSVVWDMEPTVRFVVNQVRAGNWTAQDLGSMSFMAAGGTHMAPIRDNVKEQLPSDLPDFMAEQVQAVMDGRRTPIIENTVPPRNEPEE